MAKMFTEAARIAARAQRARSAKMKREAKEQGGLDVFAIRHQTGFTWQVRRFGGVVLISGQQSFSSAAVARAKGLAELAEMRLSGAVPVIGSLAV